jgi:hypothetical protein
VPQASDAYQAEDKRECKKILKIITHIGQGTFHHPLESYAVRESAVTGKPISLHHAQWRF